MVRASTKLNAGPERHAPARFFFAAALALLVPSGAAVAQGQRTAAANAQSIAADPVLASKLLWSAMSALDHANQTGNYSVLRDLGSPSFQAGNSAATLSQTFASLRSQQVDLSYTLVLTPTFEIPPIIGQNGMMRFRGVFPLRPTPIGFDLLFENVGGKWRIFGLSVVPLVALQQQPGATRR